jgi:hypothetical protein
MNILQIIAVSFFILTLLLMFTAVAKGDVDLGSGWGTLITLSACISIGFALWYFIATAGNTVYKFN